MKNNNFFDVIIVGGSYAGLSAAMALGRALQTILLIDSGSPCNKNTPRSHNFITHDGKTPAEILNLAKQQLATYKTITIIKDKAIKGNRTRNAFEIETESGKNFTAKKIIFATGLKDVIPKIDGFEECWGISILHCPYCHGYEVRNEKTGIIGDGDSGFEFVSFISNWAKDLTLFTNGKSTLNQSQKLILEKRGIKIVEKKIQRFVHNDGHLKNIVFTSGGEIAIKALYSKVPFEQQSIIPKSMGCELTYEGYLRIGSDQRTTVDGIFACGDNSMHMRTLTNAIASGTTAGIMVSKELIAEDFHSIVNYTKRKNDTSNK